MCMLRQVDDEIQQNFMVPMQSGRITLTLAGRVEDLRLQVDTPCREVRPAGRTKKMPG